MQISTHSPFFRLKIVKFGFHSPQIFPLFFPREGPGLLFTESSLRNETQFVQYHIEIRNINFLGGNERNYQLAAMTGADITYEV